MSVLPRHVAIVMDGNGRWAAERGLPRIAGHQEGLNAVRSVIKTCSDEGIEVLSLFAFSRENWQRPDTEVSFLMNLFVQALRKEVKTLHESRIRLRFIGEREPFSKELHSCIEEAEALTRNNSGMQLVIAINYSGQWEILEAVKTSMQKAVDGHLGLSELNQTNFESLLSTSDLPSPDLLIRTSGEQRISNFFLWQLAYAELYFTQEYWPDFGHNSLKKALTWFSERERRYGKTSEQMRG